MNVFGRVMFAVPFILLSGAAFAQEAPLAKVYACADIGEGSARLACFDAAIAGLRQAQSGGDVAIVSRAQIETAEREAFGLAAPSLSALAQSAAQSAAAATIPTATAAMAAAAPSAAPKVALTPPLDSVLLRLASIERQSDGKLRFVMENGQVWRQTDGLKLTNLGKGPWTAEVKKTALGGFMLKVGERAPVRVKRME